MPLDMRYSLWLNGCGSTGCTHQDWTRSRTTKGHRWKRTTWVYWLASNRFWFLLLRSCASGMLDEWVFQICMNVSATNDYLNNKLGIFGVLKSSTVQSPSTEKRTQKTLSTASISIASSRLFKVITQAVAGAAVSVLSLRMIVVTRSASYPKAI